MNSYICLLATALDSNYATSLGRPATRSTCTWCWLRTFLMGEPIDLILLFSSTQYIVKIGLLESLYTIIFDRFPYNSAIPLYDLVRNSNNHPSNDNNSNNSMMCHCIYRPSQSSSSNYRISGPAYAPEYALFDEILRLRYLFFEILCGFNR